MRIADALFGKPNLTPLAKGFAAFSAIVFSGVGILAIQEGVMAGWLLQVATISLLIQVWRSYRADPPA